MKIFTSIVRQNCARWLFIFGVLAGLFFSSGEGIQLLPFPVAEGANLKVNASVPEVNSKSYAFSVFSSRNYSALLKAKFQKDISQYLSGESLTFERSDARAKRRLPAAQIWRQSNLLPRGSLVPNSRSKRAPPVI
ncbi:MAG TPA: hypothetical protein VGC97_01970 [Pyrinomonadaceae bacterium]|jgi:hypothetical protein